MKGKGLSSIGKHLNPQPQLVPVLGPAETGLTSSLGRQSLLTSFASWPTQVIYFLC